MVLLEAGIYYWAMNRKVEVLPDQAALKARSLILAKRKQLFKQGLFTIALSGGTQAYTSARHTAPTLG